MPLWPDPEPTELVLAAGDARLAVDLRGGRLRALHDGDRPVLDGYPAGAVPDGWRGSVLLPWPNRLPQGRWRWRGHDLQLELQGPDEPNALHGWACWQTWRVLDAADGATATMGTLVEPRPGYPFRLAAALDLRLSAERLAVTVRVRNAGHDAAPFGTGVHPYIAVGATADGGVADAEVALPARTARGPAGERVPFDGAVGRVGNRALDHSLTDLERDAEGWARATVTGGHGTVELAVDRAWPWLQAYTGDQLPPGQFRRSVAVEPMTCPPGALADGTDLVVLEPGQEWAGSWQLAWRAG